MQLLKKLCNIHAPSGNEVKMKEFILDYVNKNKAKWKIVPEIIEGESIQDCIILKFGEPKTAIFAHMDSIGFTVRYGKELIKIGGPITNDGIQLVGKDSKGEINTELYNYEDEN